MLVKCWMTAPSSYETLTPRLVFLHQRETFRPFPRFNPFMRPLFLPLIFLAALAWAQETNAPIDWDKARALHQRVQRGEPLSPEEQKYYEEARRQHDRQGGGGGNASRGQPPPPAPKGLVPLPELTGSYQGQDGGLYGGNKNEPPAAHLARAEKALKEIRPLGPDGKPADADGKVVLMSIGMSNTTQEFSAFLDLLRNEKRKAAHVVVVDGAQGAKDAPVWARKDDPVWDVAQQRITATGVTPQQVQAIWIKQAIAGPSQGYPAETDRLRGLLGEIVHHAKSRYPNLRVAYLSSRTYAGYATTRLNPEPYAYEGALAVRGLIQQQIAGEPSLDPASGQAPVLLWGPYLWANGENGEKANSFNGLAYSREDFGPDGTHPSQSGRQKVARLLLDFFTTNSLARTWFSAP